MAVMTSTLSRNTLIWPLRSTFLMCCHIRHERTLHNICKRAHDGKAPRRGPVACEFQLVLVWYDTETFSLTVKAGGATMPRAMARVVLRLSSAALPNSTPSSTKVTPFPNPSSSPFQRKSSARPATPSIAAPSSASSAPPMASSTSPQPPSRRKSPKNAESIQMIQ